MKLKLATFLSLLFLSAHAFALGVSLGNISAAIPSPKSISGLYRWYDASDSSTVARSGFGAGTVSTWTDKSGNGAVLTSGAGSEMGYTQAAQNGLNAITGNGSTSFMQNNNTTIYGADYTIMTASSSAVNGQGDLIGTGGITSGNILLMNTFSSHVRAHNFMNSGTSSVDSTGTTLINVNRICGQRLSGTTLSVIVKDIISANLTLTGAAGTPATNLILGSRNAGVSGANFNGKIYEIEIYNHSLSQGEITALYAYERNKLAITTT